MQRRPFVAPKLSYQDLIKHNDKINRTRKVVDTNSRKALNLGVVRNYPRTPEVYSPFDRSADVIGSGVGAASTAGAIYEAATGAALFNPYVATGLLAAGAAVTAYSVGKSVYKAIF
jgi:hypothetical protein